MDHDWIQLKYSIEIPHFPTFHPSKIQHGTLVGFEKVWKIQCTYLLFHSHFRLHNPFFVSSCSPFASHLHFACPPGLLLFDFSSLCSVLAPASCRTRWQGVLNLVSSWSSFMEDLRSELWKERRSRHRCITNFFGHGYTLASPSATRFLGFLTPWIYSFIPLWQNFHWMPLICPHHCFDSWCLSCFCSLLVVFLPCPVQDHEFRNYSITNVL